MSVAHEVVSGSHPACSVAPCVVDVPGYLRESADPGGTGLGVRSGAPAGEEPSHGEPAPGPIAQTVSHHCVNEPAEARPEDSVVLPITVTGRAHVIATAYDNCPICTGKTEDDPAFGITSSGIPATPERTIAVDPEVIPIGTWVYIEGLGVYRAEDTGGAIKGNRIDVFMPTHEDALNFGVQEFDVFLVEQVF